MVEFAHRACRLYQQQGSPEAGAGALEKTAKMVESKDPASAINVLQHAIEVLMVRKTQHLFDFFIQFTLFFLNFFCPNYSRTYNCSIVQILID